MESRKYEIRLGVFAPMAFGYVECGAEPAGQGFGYNALVVATASKAGPTVAAAILALGPWPWLFAIPLERWPLRLD
jgi:hypothetical protein